MTLKNQLKKLKENWLLALLVVIAVIVVLLSPAKTMTEKLSGAMYAPEAAVGRAYYDEGFAPEAEERLKVKTASLSAEVDKGGFFEAEVKLKNIVESSDAYLLNENVYKHGSERFPYHVGSYMIKVETGKYDSVIAQLKDIGEVESFNVNVEDVTERHTDLEAELAAERQRLARYGEMYAEAVEVNDKLTLTDRIFDQERRIKYLEEMLESLESRVSYSTVYVTLTEEQSGWAGISFVGFSDLVKSLVGSVSSLLKILFVVLPWAVAALLVWWIVRIIRKRK